MSILRILIKRNIKLFFKDKGMFFTALITPGILLVLYATFLGNVYHDSFLTAIPEGIKVADNLIDGLVGCQLVSSIFAVSCVTIAFCSNFLMVQDKANGTIKDMMISPVRSSVLSLAYYLASLISTLVICYIAAVGCMMYIAAIGWFMSAVDVLLMFIDITLLVFFGTALSSVINFFLSTQGQISAVGTIISAGYGFICGAYMPISSFSSGLQKAVSLLPGTYGTSLLRNHMMRGVFEEMKDSELPGELVSSFMDTVDYNIYFFGNNVSVPVMYAILGGSVMVLVAAYILLNKVKSRD